MEFDLKYKGTIRPNVREDLSQDFIRELANEII